MAGRKPKGYDLNKKLETYAQTFELDDLNKANDLASLRQLAQYEIIIESLQGELASIKKIGSDSKRVKDLNTALRDAVNSYTSLQTILGIDRRKRQSEADESVLSYIDKLKDQAKKVWGIRLKVLKCKTCNLPLMKYYIYITEKGELGSIEAENKLVEKIKYNIEIECPKCRTMVKLDERESSS
jgi:hypothetical protein